MTLNEFFEEFKLKYDGASMGGPDLDKYEMSLFLTQAVKDFTEIAADRFEIDEDSRRIVSFLLKYHDGVISIDGPSDKKIKKYNVSLPAKMMRLLREEPSLKGCVEYPEVIVARIDEVNTFLNNSFRQPNKRKVLKIEKDKVFISVFSAVELTGYKMTYLPEITPIILEELEDDLSIEGKNVPTETILPAYVHSKLIDIAVIKAIGAIRTNGLQSR
jgi:hypothetical protein